MIVVMPRRDNPPGTSDYRGIEVVRYGGGPASILENPSRSRFARFFIRNFRYWQHALASFAAGYRTCRRVRPDALIGYGDYSALTTWLLGKIFRKPTVIRLFGTFLARYLDSRLKLYYHYIQVLPFKLSARYLVMVDDGSQADRVARALGVPAARFRFWRNGVDQASTIPASIPGRSGPRSGSRKRGARIGRQIVERKARWEDHMDLVAGAIRSLGAGRSPDPTIISP